jgi:hypothetical protein
VQADIPSGLVKVFSAFEAAMGEIKPVAATVETPPNPIIPIEVALLDTPVEKAADSNDTYL